MKRKVKYHYAFKFESLELVLRKHYSNVYLSNIKDPNEFNIRKRVSIYKIYDKVGLLPRTNQIYSISFKLKVLKAIRKKILSLEVTQLKFNIPTDSIIVKFKKRFC
jgi:transposase